MGEELKSKPDFSDRQEASGGGLIGNSGWLDRLEELGAINCERPLKAASRRAAAVAMLCPSGLHSV